MEQKKPLHSHKDLIVWQRSIELVISVYKLVKNFPKEEIYALTDQMKRASVSIPSNISEGRARGTSKDFVQFLRIASGSCAEFQTQIEISKKLKYGILSDYNETESLLLEVEKMLHSMIRKINPNFISSFASEA